VFAKGSASESNKQNVYYGVVLGLTPGKKSIDEGLEKGEQPCRFKGNIH
jgi:hypothetical protein